ncbi:hypothetical protein [Haliovirga abyssi]|uniref:Glycosyltransferase subfamily 4-like N-terminal domain-containing protein n=1 Tax=Haliovirga abyssi TaxID=2996794 RepID=A0AAU9DGM2_9FUSO|nr:hypothetical protein [Haliovirga abyssi]BDU51413.1 hypothetical protein HLVA_19820 [Haliovirga abyssi]
MDKLLIITYDMIPYSNAWGNCQRMYYLGEYLNKKSDMEVHMIASKKNYIDNFNKEINFKIEYFPSENNEKNKKSKKSITARDLIKNIFKKFDKIYFNDPFPGMGLLGFLWYIKNKKNIIQYIKKEKINKIIISGPPFSLYYLVNDIKKINSNIKIILDFRDPWNTWNENKGIALYIEKKHLKKVDKIVVATDNAKKEKIKKFGIGIDKIDAIYNGYSEEDWEKINSFEENKIKTDKIVISYLGNIDFKQGGFRDTTNFFKAYEKLEKEKEKYKIRFIGVNKTSLVLELIKKYSEIDFIGKIPPRDAMLEMKKSDILLNIHTLEDKSSELLIAGKFFDYLRSGKKIFSISSDKSIVSKLIREKNLGIAVPNDEIDIYNAFKKILDFKNKENNINEIELFSREFQNRDYLKIIKKL